MPRHSFPVFASMPIYDGAAVYALVDNTGKAYIGSTNNFQRRMKAWETNMRSVLLSGQTNGLCPEAIGNALLDGNVFRAVIIEALPDNMKYPDRIAHEQQALYRAGGLQNTYNSVIPHF